MAEETISLGCLADRLKRTTETVCQMCETGQIPKSAYFIADPGTVWEMPVFYKKKVFKALEALKKSEK
ncbi:MAG: hypothetical protein U9Q97_05500 [Acidobacteriota bacterium]|nr:hypothetical protein [Acidobacteriota bacterium]